MPSYIFDNAAEAETAERFANLDALYNFRTFRFIDAEQKLWWQIVKGTGPK
jgi:hypothetical protein